MFMVIDQTQADSLKEFQTYRIIAIESGICNMLSKNTFLKLPILSEICIWDLTYSTPELFKEKMYF